MGFYRHLVRPLLFSLSAESAHTLTVEGLRLLSPLGGAARALAGKDDPRLHQALFGLEFSNPIGLAAGLDKNGVAIDGFAALGFSHVEIGTITALAQPGNERPRLFRLIDDRAVVNRMGFNNRGAVEVAARLSARPSARRAPHPPCVLGVNIGKSKVVELPRAVDDYVASARALSGIADYVVVNVSSPNTPGLRDLQAETSLGPLLSAVRRALDDASPPREGHRRKPLLVKLAPDLADESLDAAVDVALSTGCDGIIATNTTLSREGLVASAARVSACGGGGLSGAPLRARSTAVLARIARRLDGRMTLVGVGGVDSAEAAWEKIAHGASLVQLYTGLVYEGPGLVGRIRRGLLERLQAHRLSSIADAVGRSL